MPALWSTLGRWSRRNETGGHDRVPGYQCAAREAFGKLTVSHLPAADRIPLLKAAAQEAIAGGRIYDAHIAEVARAAGATVIVTDNRRHFVAALRHGIRVETPSEFIASAKRR
jgi:hypothetical protein